MYLKPLKKKIKKKPALQSTEKTVVCSYKEFTGMCQNKQVALLAFEISENIYGTEGQSEFCHHLTLRVTEAAILKAERRSILKCATYTSPYNSCIHVSAVCLFLFVNKIKVRLFEI